MNRDLLVSKDKKESHNYLLVCYQIEQSKDLECQLLYKMFNKDLHPQVSNIIHKLWPLLQVVITYSRDESLILQLEVSLHNKELEKINISVESVIQRNLKMQIIESNVVDLTPFIFVSTLFLINFCAFFRVIFIFLI